MFFALVFFAFTSLTTVDLFMLERKMVVREVRGERPPCPLPCSRPFCSDVRPAGPAGLAPLPASQAARFF
jgi:hypothetical protein